MPDEKNVVDVKGKMLKKIFLLHLPALCVLV